MINAWHLLWIIPLSASFGLGFMAVLQAGARYDKTNSTTAPETTGAAYEETV